MRAQEFIIENPGSQAGEYSTGVVKWIIEDVWSRAYPKARLYTGDSFGSNPVFASTKKQYVKDQEYYDGLADPKGHFYLQLSVGYDLPELVINVLDANAGKFPGVVAKMLDEIYQRLENQFRGQPTKRTLTVQDDASGGAWAQIAQKLGANGDLHRGHMINDDIINRNPISKQWQVRADDDMALKYETPNKVLKDTSVVVQPGKKIFAYIQGTPVKQFDPSNLESFAIRFRKDPSQPFYRADTGEPVDHCDYVAFFDDGSVRGYMNERSQ